MPLQNESAKAFCYCWRGYESVSFWGYTRVSFDSQYQKTNSSILKRTQKCILQSERKYKGNKVPILTVVIVIKVSKYTVYKIVKNPVVKPIWSTSAPLSGNNSKIKNALAGRTCKGIYLFYGEDTKVCPFGTTRQCPSTAKSFPLAPENCDLNNFVWVFYSHYRECLDYP